MSSAGDLVNQLRNVEPGTHIILSGGTYGGTYAYNLKATAAAPVVITPAEHATVVFTGKLQFNGDNACISSVTVDNGNISIAGDNNRITRSLFTGLSNINYVVGAGFNRFDHNDAILDRAGGSGDNDFIIFLRPKSTAEMYNGNRFDHNYFTTNTAHADASVQGYVFFLGKYGAATGYPAMYNYGSFKTIIENNLIENWGRKAVIESKSSDNVFRNNTLIDTGRILQRHNGRNPFQGNYFDHVRAGLFIREYDNRIIGNYFNATDITLYSGSRSYPLPGRPCWQARAWLPAGYQAPQGPPAVRTVIDNNKGATIILGPHEGRDECLVPVLQTQILCHPDSVRHVSDVGTTGPSSTSCSFTMPHKLTRDEVGRNGPEN